MVFIDAFDKSGKVPPVLVDGDGTFLQSLNKARGFWILESWHVWCHSKDGSCSMLLHGLIYTCIYYLYCASVHVLYFSLYIHAAFLDIYIYIFANIHITIHTYMYIYIHVYNVSVNESVSHVRRISLEPYLSFREIPFQNVPSIEGGTQIGNVSYHKT